MSLSQPPQIEARFIELMSQLFQLREAEQLDFGIYRLIRRHNRRMREFLGIDDQGRRVPEGGSIDAIFKQAFETVELAHAEESKHELARLAAAIGIPQHESQAAIDEILAKAESIPAMRQQVADYRELRSILNSAYSAADDRAEALNRLIEFYDRHYQDGDFIVQRRYGRDGARYIKSNGDDTEFRWATEDMYYIKSGDIFTDYPVRLSNGKMLIFAVDADTLAKTRADLKPNDKASYQYRSIKDDKNGWRVIIDYVKGAQTGARLEKIVAETAAATGVKAEEIAPHLRRYIARNQSDFFIHKRLREALDEDLDVFLKTEVLDADQLFSASDQRIPARTIRLARAIREIGRSINAFLGVLEDHQKRLWEKKKLVLETRYIITLDRIERLAGKPFADSIVPGVLRNSAQVKEWQELGLGEHRTLKSLLRPEGTYLPLPVDTQHFNDEFKWSLIANITSAVGLDEAIDGVAIHSDNWQALNTLQGKYRGQVKCSYIDPPYNTNASGIPYKNGYRDSSWISMMGSRVEYLHRMLRHDGALFVSIDKIERTPLEHLLDRTFGEKNRVEELIWVQNTNDGKSPTYSTNHEYVKVYAKQREAVEQDNEMFREPKPGYAEVMELIERLNPMYPATKMVEKEIANLYSRHKADFRDEIEMLGLDWDIERRNDPWKGLYPYGNVEYRDSEGRYVPESLAKERQASIWVWRESDWTIMSAETKQSETIRDPDHPNFRYYRPTHPVTMKPCTLSSRGWKGTQHIDPEYPERNSFESLMVDHRIVFGDDEKKVPQQKRMLHEVDTNVAKSVFNDYSDGEKQTTAMFGKAGLFLAPKHTNFVSRFILQGSRPDSIVIDCFGGSGSTAHSVIELNRSRQSTRKFITVEVNRYFSTLIIPRLVKAGSASRWVNGTAMGLNGSGLFMRIQKLEQYDDTLENLATGSGESGNLFSGPEALAYDLDTEARRLLMSAERFSKPFGMTLRRIENANVSDGPVDLVESLIYFLGLHVQRLYRENGSVVITGRINGRNETATVLWRDNVLHGEEWIKAKMADHPADRFFTNAPETLAFEGIEQFESIEAVFVEQMNGAN